MIYKPDILFLQEIDLAKYKTFWVPICVKLGLESHFSTYPGKHHGLVVAYSKKHFILKEKNEFFYDGLPTSANGSSLLVPMNSLETKNSGIVLALEVNKQNNSDQSSLNDKAFDTVNEGIVIATTHLYWHPFGSFVRAIQCGQLIDKVIKFSTRETSNYSQWPIFIGGDFNSSPDDLPYQFLITQPHSPSDINKTTRDIAVKSLLYLYNKYGAEKEQQEPETFKREEMVQAVDDEGVVTALDPEYIDKCIASILPFYWTENSDRTPVKYRAESLYGEHYRKVDPENSKTHNPDFHEPEFSNWAHTWQGLLDYLFLLENVEACEGDPKKRVLVKELLKMPTGSEIGEAGQPRVGEYPSDHLCLMATVEI